MQRAKSEWYQNKSELIEAQNAYRASMATLSLLSGQKIDELNVREVQVPKKSVDWVLDEKQQRYFVEAKNSSLDLQIEEYNLKSTTEESSARKALYWPKIEVIGQLSHQKNQDLNNVNIENPEDWLLSLELSWNLFSGLGTSAQTKEQAALIRQARYKQAEIQNDLQENIQILLNQIYNNQQQFYALEQAIAFKILGYEETKKRWQLGMASFLDVQKEKTSLSEQRKQSIELNYNTWLKFFELKKLAGVLKPEDLDKVSTHPADIEI